MRIKLFSKALKKGSSVLNLMTGNRVIVEFVYPSRRLATYQGQTGSALTPEQVSKVRHAKK